MGNGFTHHSEHDDEETQLAVAKYLEGEELEPKELAKVYEYCREVEYGSDCLECSEYFFKDPKGKEDVDEYRNYLEVEEGILDAF